MFISKFFQIFFRNKGTEIKGFFSTRHWYNLAEALIIIVIVIVTVSLLMSISYGTGYLLIDVLDWVDVIVDGGANTPYMAIGLLFWIGLFLVFIVGIGIWHFIKWIWTNTKIAWAEAMTGEL